MSKEYTVDVPEELAAKLRMALNIAANESPVGVLSLMVDEFKELKIAVNPKEHPPPHFHVIHKESNVSYSIENCACIAGHGELLKYEKVIKRWWGNNKQKLIEYWNKSRPSDCPVGIYREG